MKSIIRDIQFGLRILRKNPLFTGVAILTLGLGIGSNVTVFTLVNAILFKGLPFEDSDRIVMVSENNVSKDENRLYVPFVEYKEWRAATKSFKGLAAAQPSITTVSDPGLPTESYSSARVSSNTFSLMAQKPLLGRDFLPDEDQGAGVYVVILSHELWQKRYGGDPNILGRNISLNETDATVVGVMPAGTRFPYDQDLWYPLFATNPASSLLRRDSRSVSVFGRLADGITLREAQAEMSVIAKRQEQDYPKTNQGVGIVVEPYVEFYSRGTIRQLFLLMLGAVGFVLLIACANVANLLLSRSLSRGKEISIRTALGASRTRIVRQLLIESALLGVLGGALGLLLSLWGVRVFQSTLPNWVPYWLDFSLDYRVVLYVGTICLGVSFLFGLAPALHVSKVDLNRALKEGTRGSGGGQSRLLSRALVAGEVGLALVLLVGAGLMVRSFLNQYRTGSEFENRNVMTLMIPFSGRNYLAPANRLQFLERLEPELERIPGVRSTALSSTLPLSWAYEWKFELEGQPAADANDLPIVNGVEISSNYFQVLGIPILSGRTFNQSEAQGDRSVAIVNRRFAEKHWPGQDPVGKRFRLAGNAELGTGQEARSALDKGSSWLTVVGQTANVKQGRPNRSELEPVVYVPYRQTQMSRYMIVLAQTAGDPQQVTVPLRNAVQGINPQMPVIEVMTLKEHLATTRWFLQFFGTIFLIFSGIGLFLAAVGIYAVMAYSVSQRTQEIGIRMAFGAQRGGILKLVVSQGLRLALIGVMVGFVVSIAITRLMERVLYGVSPTDTATFFIVGTVLVAAALLASYLPARRASMVEPMQALRLE